jgi:hypothetical protein
MTGQRESELFKKRGNRNFVETEPTGLPLFGHRFYEKKEGIGHLVLNKPETLNGYNIQMRDDLRTVFLL